MNGTTSPIPMVLGALPFAVLYSLLLITLRRRFGGVSLVVCVAVAVVLTVGFVAPQAFKAEQDYPVLVVAFVAILFVAVFATPALVLWRAGKPNPPTVAKQLFLGVLAFYGGLLLATVAGFLLMFIAQNTNGRAV